MRKFNISESEQFLDYFQEHGYVIIKGAFNNKKIDNFIKAYTKIKENPFFVYYSQSSHSVMKPKLNKHGFILDSMQSATNLSFFKRFTATFKECLYDRNVSKALNVLTGFKSHISWQNMFFDKSTGTVDHQDSWYLDTNPAGNMIGVWYALEDISKESGAFYVLDKTHKLGLISAEDHPDHDSYLEFIQDILNKNINSKKLMTIDKGDIILWSSFLIHGADKQTIESLSRKSFTSHFYPLGLNPKQTHKNSLFSIYNHERPKKTINPNLFSAISINGYIYNLLLYLLYIRDLITGFTRTLSVNKVKSMKREDINR